MADTQDARSKSTRQKNDWSGVDRKKQKSPSGSWLFSILRLLDIPLQYQLLSGLGARLIKTLGGSPLTSALSIQPQTTIIGLTPYHTLLVALASATTAKHIFWKLSIADYFFPPQIATIVALYNTALNTSNTLLALWATSSNDISRLGISASWSELLDPTKSSIPYGVALFAAGIAIETIAEIQRKAFKAKPQNRDMPFAGGLFGWARNINYGGYLLWRIGFAVVCAGLPWGVVIAAWQAGDFIGRACPSMDAYCEGRYGEEWLRVREKVRWRLLPGIY